jgi:hypothetical protein
MTFGSRLRSAPLLASRLRVSRCAFRLAPLVAPLAAAGLVLTPAALAERLYELESYCSLNGTEAVPCRIEAINGAGATEYRHQLGGREVRFRILEEPTTRIEIWDAAANRWRSVRTAAAFFALNAVCLDGTSFCAINPNYLNSVRQDLGRAADGRSVLEVHFGNDGRIDASCYDAGCPDRGRPSPAP